MRAYALAVAQHGLGAGGGRGGKRNGAPSRQAFHQHTPTLTDHFLAADHPIDRHEDILCPIGTVGKRRARWQVSAANVDTGMIGRDQGKGNADILTTSEDIVRVK